jgi:outer membrane protein assembly factor BamA
LFIHEGQTLDREKLDQSLRNIRALDFIGDAHAKIENIPGDSVDIFIDTEDLWTTVAGISSEGGGGLYNIRAYAEEKNVAGQGIGVESDVIFSSDNNEGYFVHVYDPRFAGTRNALNAQLQDYTYARILGLTLSRPFFSVDTRWSYAFELYDKDLIPRIFSGGEEQHRYDLKQNYYGARLTRAFGRYKRLETSVNYTFNKYDYSLIDDYPELPEDESIGGPGVGLKLSTRRYITATYLDEFGNTEDLIEHATLATSVSWSGPTFNAGYQATIFSIGAGFFIRPRPGLYAGFSDTYSTHFIGGNHRQRISNTAAAIVYIKPSTYQLLAARSIVTFGWRQKPDYQLVLGGDNGLRGYPDRYLSGTRLSLTNIEYRVFSPYEILTVGLGAAAFFDAGYVWGRDDKIAAADLKTDIGIGLRFGLTKSSTSRIIKLDLARALNEDNWYISFGTENTFSLGEFF